MQKFTLSSSTFSQLQKRLLALPTSDKGSCVSFLVEQDKVKVFYNGKVDKGEASSLFYEELETIKVDGTSQLSSCLINNFQSIKIPENSNEDKFPQCKEISFCFTDSILTLEYSVKWNKHTAANTTRLNFALIEGSQDLKQYDSLFADNGSNKVKIATEVLLEAIQQTGFIKSDATSKEGNGCFFDFKDQDIVVVATDSSMAVRYKNKLTQPVEKKTSFIISNPALNSIRNFILDTKECTLTVTKSGIFVDSGNRKMVVPRVAGTYLISDHSGFFDLQALQPVACLDLKPLVFTLGTLTAKTNDIYKRANLIFDNQRFDLKTQTDLTENIPCTVLNSASINVNGDFLTLACQRVLTLDIFSKLFFDKATDKIAISTDESDKLVFLVQGLSF
jgi:hypothetical protein